MICDHCGGRYEIKKGNFVFPDPHVGDVTVEDTSWRECNSCGSSLLPSELCKRIDIKTREIENGKRSLSMEKDS